jgi:hypothetical protein
VAWVIPRQCFFYQRNPSRHGAAPDEPTSDLDGLKLRVLKKPGVNGAVWCCLVNIRYR